MGPLGVVELDVFAKPFFEFGSAGGGVQVNVPVLDCPPQPLHEDVVDGPAAPVHGDGHVVGF